MRKSIKFTLILVLISSMFFSCEDDKQLKDRTTSGILKYLASLPDKNLILSGQECGDGDFIEWQYDRFITDLEDLSGKAPAIVGADYGYKKNDLSKINEKLIYHWNRGGLVTLSWHADNPFLTSNEFNPRWNSVENRSFIDLNSLLKSAPDNDAKERYRKELKSIANALMDLKKLKITVLWRPFHEMNGDWYWWGIDRYNNGQTNEQAYKSLWKDLYATLTVEYGLDNLIWIYAPSISEDWKASVLSYYPDDDFVDIAGVDSYTKASAFNDYDSLKKLNKTIGISEIGPIEVSYGKFDETKIIDTLVGKASYFLQWYSWSENSKDAAVSIKDNLNFREMMNDERVITLSDLAGKQ